MTLTIDRIQGLTKQLIGILGANLPKNLKISIGLIPTGDGFYLVLHPAMRGYGALLALGLRNQLLADLQCIQGLHKGFRIAVHFGQVIPFKDINGRLNFLGTGLNDAARLISPSSNELERQRFKQLLEAFSLPDAYVAASSEALREFDETFQNRAKFLGGLNFRRSDQLTTTDKHTESHCFHFIETDLTYAATAPREHSLSEEQIITVNKLIEDLDDPTSLASSSRLSWPPSS